MASKLDRPTLLIAARALGRRAELLRRTHERKGWSPSHHFLHRAAELEFMADTVRGLRIVESAGGKRRKKL